MKVTVFAVLVSLVCSSVGQAALLVEFDMHAANGTPSVLNSYVGSTSFAAGSGLNTATYAGLNATSRNWNVSTSASAVAGNRFWEFTVTADPGRYLNLDNLKFSEARGTSGPLKFELFVNGNSLGVTSLGAPATRTIDLTGIGLTNSANFQFVAWAAPNNGVNSAWALDDIQLSGAAVPEPGACLLAAALAIHALCVAHRRRRQAPLAA